MNAGVNHDRSIRTRANIEVALDRVCQRRPDGEKHEFRKKVAEAIIRSVKRGNTSWAVWTAAGERAISIYSKSCDQKEIGLERV